MASASSSSRGAAAGGSQAEPMALTKEEWHAACVEVVRRGGWQAMWNENGSWEKAADTIGVQVSLSRTHTGAPVL